MIHTKYYLLQENGLKSAEKKEIRKRKNGGCLRIIREGKIFTTIYIALIKYNFFQYV